MSLEADLNRGIKALSKTEVESRFTQIINKEYELTLVEVELKVKKSSFDTYFGAQEEATPVINEQESTQ